MAAGPLAGSFSADEFISRPPRPAEVLAEESQQDTVARPVGLGLGAYHGSDIKQFPAFARLEWVGCERFGIIPGLAAPRVQLAPIIQDFKSVDSTGGRV